MRAVAPQALAGIADRPAIIPSDETHVRILLNRRWNDDPGHKRRRPALVKNGDGSLRLATAVGRGSRAYGAAVVLCKSFLGKSPWTTSFPRPPRQTGLSFTLSGCG